MLNNVPMALKRMARNVVVNHPNTLSCKVFRKRVVRTASGEMGGLPTLGGLGVLDSGDEDDIEWDFVGNGYAMRAEPFGGGTMMDRQDAAHANGGSSTFMIEPEAAPGTPEHFTVQNHDVFYLLLGDAVKLAFEVVRIEPVVDIPPYGMRYVVNRRDELDLVGEE